MRLSSRLCLFVFMLFLLLQIVALPAAPASADHAASHITTLLSPQTTSSNYFGVELAMSGDTLAISAPFDDERGVDTGAVYIYIRQNNLWTQQAKLFASVPKSNSRFGSSIDLEGNTLVVGAPSEHSSANYAGAAYVFVREGTSWSQQARFVLGSTDFNAHLGSAIDLDGETLAVGSDQGKGTIHFFNRSGAQWTEAPRISYEGWLGDQFGSSIKLKDGLLVVGAAGYSAEAGAVFIYVRTATGWQRQQTIYGQHEHADFGRSLALLGDTLVVGAPRHFANGQSGGATYIFRRGSTGWSQEAFLLVPGLQFNDQFGIALALNDSMLVIGALGKAPKGWCCGPVGLAYVYTKQTTGWQQQMILQRPMFTEVDHFGSAIALENGVLAISAPSADSRKQSEIGAVADVGAVEIGTLHGLTRAVDDQAQTREEQAVTINVAANDVLFDDGSTFDTSATRVIIDRNPQLGTVEVGSAGTVVYTPALNKSGIDTFTYSSGWGTTATVTVTIDPVPDPPRFTSTPNTAAEETQRYSYAITASDVDTGDTLTFSAPQLPGWLSLTAGGNGTATLSGTPAFQDIGAHPVRLMVTDNAGLTATQNFTITVQSYFPFAPTNLKAAPISPSRIQLNWTDQSDNETSFRIERSEDDGTSWQAINSVLANTTVYTDGGRVCNTPYRYRVYAVKSERSSVASNQAHTTIADCSLPPPTDLTAIATNASTVRLYWRDQSQNEAGFRIERSEDGGTTWNEIAETEPNLMVFSDTQVVCGPTYRYRVRAFHAFTVSEPSASASILVCAPAHAPADLTAVTISRHQIDLTWTDTTTNEDGFRLQYSSQPGVWTELQLRASSTRHEHYPLRCGTFFTYRIAAYNNVGNGPFSELVVAGTQPCIHQRIYVDHDATGANDGSSWTNAYTNLQQALNPAQHIGDTIEIWVAEGVYKPSAGTDRAATFRLVQNVAIYGGFRGGETTLNERDWRSNITTLSGDIGVTGDASDNSYHVVSGLEVGRTAVLDGVTITAGNANGDWTQDKSTGGGLFNFNAQPTIRNVIFSDNRAGDGGGIGNRRASPILANLLFLRNSAGRGGGMFNYDSSNPTLTNAVFSGNTATDGGAIYNYWSSDPTLTNVTFSYNRVSGWGGAILNTANANPQIRNAIFWGNSSQTGLAGDVAQIYAESSNAYASVSDTLLQTHLSNGGTRTRIADPLFVDADGADNVVGTLDDNLRLQTTSPAIDAANNTSISSGVAFDLDDHPRFRDHPLQSDTGIGTPPIVDMGAYEFQPSALPNSPPIDLTATTLSRTEVNLTWSDQSSNEEGFKVERRPIDSESWAEIAQVPANSTAYRDRQLTCGSRYAYRVRGVTSGGFTDYSNSSDAATNPCQPGVVYVNHSAAGLNTGASWAHAYTDLQAALANAFPGDELWVAAGTYTPTSGTDRAKSFQLVGNVAIYGGFIGSETRRDQRDWRQHETILSGDLQGDDPVGVPNDTSRQTLMDDNSFHVVISKNVTATAILDGVSIIGGNSIQGQDHGGGLLNQNGSPVLRNITFRANAAEKGGGMADMSGSAALLSAVTFSQNYATYGGALYAKDSNSRLESVTFYANTSPFGGGMINEQSHPRLRDVEFRENSSSAGPGAMYNVGSSPSLSDVRFTANEGTTGGMLNNQGSRPVLRRVTFSKNVGRYAGNNGGGGMTNTWSDPTLIEVVFESNVSTGGGGMRNYSSSPKLFNVTFVGNRATDNPCCEGGGGAMFNGGGTPVLQNVIFNNNAVLNSRDSRGGAIVNYGSSPILLNVTAIGNSATYGGAMYSTTGSPTIYNSIFWDNISTGSGPHIITSGSMSVSFSLIQGGQAGTGNIDADPRFRDRDGLDNMLGTLDDNLRLQDVSPAIDAGSNTLVSTDVVDVDNDGNFSEWLPYDRDRFRRFYDVDTVADTGSGTAPIVDMGAYEYWHAHTQFLPVVSPGGSR